MDPINDEFDYEKIHEILEEEERNRRQRKEQEARKEKEKYKEKSERVEVGERCERSDKYKRRERSGSRERNKDKNRDRDKDKDKDKDRDRNYQRDYKSSRSRSRDRRRKSSRRSHSRDRNDRKEKEERHKEKVIVEKTIEEAKRQAIEAQRDDCTILVYRLHLNAKEKDLFNFFATAEIGRIVDIKVIRDPRTKKSKGAAYVEFQNQDTVPLAVALSGRQIYGQSVTIQHSQAEKNRLAAAAKYKKEVIKEQQRINSKRPLEIGDNTEVPMKIYVGGLTEHLADISDMDLRSIFSPFGEIDLIDMPRDPITLKSKGYCFIQFRKVSQAQAAIASMNGFKYKGKILKVGIAHEEIRHGNEIFTTTGEIDEESHLHNLQSKQALMQKLSRDTTSIGKFGMEYPSSSSTNATNILQTQSAQYPTSLQNLKNVPPNTQSSYVLLTNLFNPEEVNLTKDPNFYNDTREDVFEECGNLGKVDHVFVDPNSAGNVWIKFANNNFQAAQAAVEQMYGRWFAGRPILAKLVPEDYFEENVKKFK